MKDRCKECRYKMERHGIVDGEDVYYCDICGIYQSYPLEEEALLAAEKKNCGCGKDPCVTYGAESEKKPEKDHNCIACGHHSAHITMGDDRFCYNCYHYAETFEAEIYDGTVPMMKTAVASAKKSLTDLEKELDRVLAAPLEKRARELTKKIGGNLRFLEDVVENSFYAETFNSYKVAPELSSYTVDELVDSIAGPQGSAAYDEMVYDPIAQDRQSAESFSLPKTLLLFGAMAAGLGFGVFLTKKLGDITPETSDEGGA